MNKLEIYIDGASKGNPGPSGIGVVICRDGQTVKNISRFIGRATNNVAEYTALIFGLQEGLILKSESIKINTDSQLMYRQLKKIYKVKHPNIIGLYNQGLHLISAFKEVSLNFIPREQNRTADKLATKAIKQELKNKTRSNIVRAVI
jgi:ribonuclease HI